MLRYEKDNKERRPLEHYLPRYAALDPVEASARCGAAWDGSCFRLRFLGCDYAIGHPEFSVRALTEGFSPLDRFPAARLLVLRYLLEGRLEPSSGRFLTFREVPWGETYWKAFQGRCIFRLAFGFGRNGAGFSRAMERLGAGKAPTGDFSGEVELLPGLRLQLILWGPDEEFDPSAQITFSDNFPLAFTAEDMAVVGDVVLGTVKELSK